MNKRTLTPTPTQTTQIAQPSPQPVQSTARDKQPSPAGFSCAVETLLTLLARLTAQNNRLKMALDGFIGSWAEESAPQPSDARTIIDRLHMANTILHSELDTLDVSLKMLEDAS